jgi:hypothetical protein
MCGLAATARGAAADALHTHPMHASGGMRPGPSSKMCVWWWHQIPWRRQQWSLQLLMGGRCVYLPPVGVPMPERVPWGRRPGATRDVGYKSACGATREPSCPSLLARAPIALNTRCGAAHSTQNPVRAAPPAAGCVRLRCARASPQRRPTAGLGSHKSISPAQKTTLYVVRHSHLTKQSTCAHRPLNTPAVRQPSGRGGRASQPANGARAGARGHAAVPRGTENFVRGRN